jgi:hypothetical protein
MVDSNSYPTGKRHFGREQRLWKNRLGPRIYSRHPVMTVTSECCAAP